MQKVQLRYPRQRNTRKKQEQKGGNEKLYYSTFYWKVVDGEWRNTLGLHLFQIPVLQ